MKFQGAIIKELGVTFAVVVVKKSVIDNRFVANRAVQSFQPLFPSIPVVLMAQDFRSRPKYYSRRDIVRFLARVPIHAIPWKEYTVN